MVEPAKGAPLRQRVIAIIGIGKAEFDQAGDRKLVTADIPMGLFDVIEQTSGATGLSRSAIVKALLYEGAKALELKN